MKITVTHTSSLPIIVRSSGEQLSLENFHALVVHGVATSTLSLNVFHEDDHVARAGRCCWRAALAR